MIIGYAKGKIEQIFLRQAKVCSSPVFLPESFLHIKTITSGLDGQLLEVIFQGKSLFGPLFCPFAAEYQLENVRTVAGAVMILRSLGIRIIDAAMKEGIRGVREFSGLRGRMDIISKEPLVIADVAHNEDGFAKILPQIEQFKVKKKHFVFGMVNDKDRSAILKQLPQNAQYYFVKANIDRCLDANELMKEAKEYNLKGKAYSSVKEGYLAALENAKKEDLIFICGSTFVVAEVI